MGAESAKAARGSPREHASSGIAAMNARQNGLLIFFITSRFEVHRGALARCHQPCPVLAANRQMRPMSDNRHKQHSGSRLGLVLRDVQFWVPVAVLLGGLLVLRWIS